MGTIGKALRLLDLISGLEQDAGLSEIARASGLDKATARRFLVALQAHGFLEQDHETRKYRIGGAPVRLAQIRESRLPLVQRAIPLLRALASRFEETVHMGEFSGGRLSTIHAEEPARAHRISARIGTVLPLHATASGLAYLSFCPPVLLEEYLALPRSRYTDQTVTDEWQLRALVAEIRDRGYSINRQGLEGGMVSVAAPILAGGRPPIGTVAIAAPLARTDDKAIATYGTAVRETAAALSSTLFSAQQPSTRTVWTGKALTREEYQTLGTGFPGTIPGLTGRQDEGEKV